MKRTKMDHSWLDDALSEDDVEDLGVYDTDSIEGRVRSLTAEGSGFSRDSVNHQVNGALQNLADDIRTDRSAARRDAAWGMDAQATSEAANKDLLARQQFADLLEISRGKVAFNEQVAAAAVEFDSDGVVSKRLGVEAAEYFGGSARTSFAPEDFTPEAADDASEALRASRRRSEVDLGAGPDFSREVDPDREPQALASEPVRLPEPPRRRTASKNPPPSPKNTSPSGPSSREDSLRRLKRSDYLDAIGRDDRQLD